MKRADRPTHKKILNAALRVFGHNGFFEACVDDIARAAGVAKGTIYLYFKDKPAIYVEAIDDHFKDGMMFLRRIEGESGSARKKLEDIALNLSRHMRRFGSSFPAITLENIDLAGRVLKGLRPVITAHMQDVTRLIARIVDEGIKHGEFRRVDSEAAAIHFLSVVRTLVVASTIFRRRPIDSKAAFDIFLKGLEKRR